MIDYITYNSHFIEVNNEITDGLKSISLKELDSFMKDIKIKKGWCRV